MNKYTLMLITDSKKKENERPPFHIDDELIEAAKKAAEIFEQEEKEYAEYAKK